MGKEMGRKNEGEQKRSEIPRYTKGETEGGREGWARKGEDGKLEAGRRRLGLWVRRDATRCCAVSRKGKIESRNNEEEK